MHLLQTSFTKMATESLVTEFQVTESLVTESQTNKSLGPESQLT
jgi:hypothetical protein